VKRERPLQKKMQKGRLIESDFAKNAQLNAQYIDDKMLSKKGGIEMPISEKKKASNNRYTKNVIQLISDP
jgi:hypothetical protein